MILVKNSLTSKIANWRRDQMIQGQKWAFKKVYCYSNDIWEEKTLSMFKASPASLSGVVRWTNNDSGQDESMGPVTIFIISVTKNDSVYAPWSIRVGCNSFFWRQ